MNRNKLLALFVSNLTNVVVHRILKKAIDKQEIAEKYTKEMRNSLSIAKECREKINPINMPLPDKEEVKIKVINRVNRELKLRIEKGYKNIDLNLVEIFVEEALDEMAVI